VRLFDHERFDPRELFLKPLREVCRSVLEKHNKAKREEDEESEPKQSADDTHEGERNLGGLSGQSQVVQAVAKRAVRGKVRIAWRGETDNLFGPCTFRFSI
jgi:hypothetical protein